VVVIVEHVVVLYRPSRVLIAAERLPQLHQAADRARRVSVRLWHKRILTAVFLETRTFTASAAADLSHDDDDDDDDDGCRIDYLQAYVRIAALECRPPARGWAIPQKVFDACNSRKTDIVERRSHDASKEKDGKELPL